MEGLYSAVSDISLLTLDPASTNCYMMQTTSNVGLTDVPIANNGIFKLPLPTLSPTAYIAPSGYGFNEGQSVQYVTGFGVKSNSYNGMSA